MTARQSAPNLFIAGVPKAGTRSLTEALGANQDVYVPFVDCPRFFLDLDIDRAKAEFFRVIQDEEEYLALYAPGGNARYRCDSSVEYVFHPEAMERIRELSPDARAIVVLRDPVQRAYSHYLNDVREGIERRTFVAAVRDQRANPDVPWPSRYVAYGHYAAGLARAFEIFGADLHVVLFEEMTRDPGCVLAGVAEFLDLARGDFPAEAFGHRNRAELPRGELAGRAMGSLALRRVGRRLVPPALRPLARSAFVGRPAPSMDSDAQALLLEEYREEPGSVAALLGREPQWASFSRAA